MALYEMRTYTLKVGKLPEAVSHYRELGWPALEKGGFGEKLIGYFIADTGTINRLVHASGSSTTTPTAGPTGRGSSRTTSS